MITVITPTNRKDSLRLVDTALCRQTYTDFEWIISKPKDLEVSVNYDRTKILIDPQKQEGDYWTLYSAYNNILQRSKGDLIVSIQDFTFVEPEALEKLYFYFSKDNSRVITGVGNKYESVYPDLGAKTWQDPREDGTTAFRECIPDWIEFNFCAIPKKAFYDVGGFDEELNKYSGICGLDVVKRIELIGGYTFHIDQSNKSYSEEHGRPVMWEERNAIHGPYQKRLQEYINNPVLPYLIT